MSNALDDLRDDMITASNEKKGTGENELEGLKFKPSLKTYIVRILPPQRMKEMRCFYATPSYNFINDEPFFSLKKFGDKFNPIDSYVRKTYKTAQERGDEALQKKMMAIKRKRNYYFEILLLGVNDEIFDEPMYKIMLDTSNRGLLAKKLCSIMGVPFFKDVEDRWVDENSKKIDTDKDYVNLIDVKNGFDVKITKTKWGEKNWEIDYDITPLTKKGPRALTKKEVEIIKANRVDLFEVEEYVTDIKVVEATLKAWLEGQLRKDEESASESDGNYDLDDVPFGDAEETPVKTEKKSTKEDKAPKSSKEEKSEKKIEKKKDKKEEKDAGFDIEDDAEFEQMLEEMEKDESVTDDDLEID